MTLARSSSIDEGCGDELTPEQSAALFDRIARRNMQISGAEFLTRWDRGDYEGKDWDDVPGLVEVGIALPFAR